MRKLDLGFTYKAASLSPGSKNPHSNSGKLL